MTIDLDEEERALVASILREWATQLEATLPLPDVALPTDFENARKILILDGLVQRLT